jgi:FAD/FMN-containing dehydrogenase
MTTLEHVHRMLRISADVTARARRSREGGAAIDVSRLSRILAIDVAARTCVAEPLVTFRDLVRATGRHGLVPRVVPELDAMTLGDAVAGCADGGFHHTCIEYEVVTGTGDVVRCSRKHDSELFGTLPGSYGTVGIITELTFELIEASAPVLDAAPARHVRAGGRQR